MISMVQAYNFLASWQLFPEKCDFEYQIVPKSGNYKIETVQNGHFLSQLRKRCILCTISSEPKWPTNGI
jgi:hypothetical protein